MISSHLMLSLLNEPFQWGLIYFESSSNKFDHVIWLSSLANYFDGDTTSLAFGASPGPLHMFLVIAHTSLTISKSISLISREEIFDSNKYIACEGLI